MSGAEVSRKVLLDLCGQLGLDPHDVREMTITARDITAEVVKRDAEGNMVLDGSGLDVEFSTRAFKVVD